MSDDIPPQFIKRAKDAIDGYEGIGSCISSWSDKDGAVTQLAELFYRQYLETKKATFQEAIQAASGRAFELKDESYKVDRESEKGMRVYAKGQGAHEAAIAINALAESL